MAKTDPLDPNVPASSEDPKLGDNRIRELAKAVAELLAVNHYMGTDGGAGVGYNEDAAGEHTKIKFNAPISKPTHAANKLFLYPKDVSGKIEFHILDEDGNEVQVTSAGKILFSSLSNILNNTYLQAKDAAGTGTVDLIKADANDVAVVPDGTETATDAAPDADKELTNKKYTDTRDAFFGTMIPAVSGAGTGYGLESPEESVTLQNGLILKFGVGASCGANSSKTITFGTAFPTDIICVNVTHIGSLYTAAAGARSVSAQSKTAFTYANGVNQSGTFNWIAIGY